MGTFVLYGHKAELLGLSNHWLSHGYWLKNYQPPQMNWTVVVEGRKIVSLSCVAESRTLSSFMLLVFTENIKLPACLILIKFTQPSRWSSFLSVFLSCLHLNALLLWLISQLWLALHSFSTLKTSHSITWTFWFCSGMLRTFLKAFCDLFMSCLAH